MAENDSTKLSRVSSKDLISDSNEDEDEVPDSFLCCICLEILYKPVVLTCGHVSCFWCVHLAMNGIIQSRCAMCRTPYIHFPSICQLLHFIILRLYPKAYKKREKEVLAGEKARAVFSPQFDSLLINEKVQINEYSSTHCAPSHKNENTSQFDSQLSNESVQKNEDFSSHCVSSCKNENAFTNNAIGSESNPGSSFSESSQSKDCNLISVTDVLCAACQQLLCRPVVLNCGHVFCESCIVSPLNETLRCQICQSPHPGGFPKVCFLLHDFLKERFPKDYDLKRESFEMKKEFKEQNLSSNLTGAKSGESRKITPIFSFLRFFDPEFMAYRSSLHGGVGCDSCGLYPISGKRYKCKDCTEKVGFDLCESCYNTGSKLPGRFNQQHTPEHTFQLIHSTDLNEWSY